MKRCLPCLGFRKGLQELGSSEQLKGPELIAPSLSLCCVAGEGDGVGGGARVENSFTQGPNSSAIFRGCKAGYRGAWAAAFLCLLLVGVFRRPSSCCRAWPLPMPRQAFYLAGGDCLNGPKNIALEVLAMQALIAHRASLCNQQVSRVWALGGSFSRKLQRRFFVKLRRPYNTTSHHSKTHPSKTHHHSKTYTAARRTPPQPWTATTHPTPPDRLIIFLLYS